MHAALGTNDRVLAVTAVPDDKRGERLVVLHLPMLAMSPRELGQKLAERGLPNLWVPGDRDYYPVNELPLLGSGKLDLKRVKDLAMQVTR